MNDKKIRTYCMNYLVAVFVCIMIIGTNCSAQQNYQPIPAPQGKYEIISSPIASPHSFDQLIRMSDLIIEGTVEKSFSAQRSNADDPKSLVTYAQISIDKVIRGEISNGQKSIAVAEQGGNLEGYEVISDH